MNLDTKGMTRRRFYNKPKRNQRPVAGLGKQQVQMMSIEHDFFFYQIEHVL